MFTLTFYFNDIEYSAIVNQKKISDHNSEYRVTILNGDLEQLLFGDHIFTEKGGHINDISPDIRDKKTNLKSQIIKSLNEHIRMENVY